MADSPWINLSRTFNTACRRNRLTSLEIVLLLMSPSCPLRRSKTLRNCNWRWGE